MAAQASMGHQPIHRWYLQSLGHLSSHEEVRCSQCYRTPWAAFEDDNCVTFNNTELLGDLNNSEDLALPLCVTCSEK